VHDRFNICLGVLSVILEAVLGTQVLMHDREHLLEMLCA